MRIDTAKVLRAARRAAIGVAIGASALLALAPGASADTEKRVALVIGNGAYTMAPRLDNPPIDAKAVATSLKRLGFEVVEGYDLNVAQMRKALSDFSAALPDAKSAIVYYAGHGVSVDDENYLLPTDIVLKSPTDLDLGAISVSLVLKQMKREDRVNVVILDACRDNPFAADLARNRTRAIIGERGLSRIDGDLARGTLIAFASDPKSVALDGPAGRHSPFTEALVAHLEDPGVSIDTVMTRVRADVWENTRHSQLPWVNTSIIGEYLLNPHTAPIVVADLGKTTAVDAAPPAAAAPALAVSPGDRQSAEALLWESAQHSNLGADYQAYLDAFPNGLFAQMARNRIASLGAPASTTDRVADPAAAPVAGPVAPSEKDLKAEIGTAETEKNLNLSPADRKEIQQRLTVLEFYKGPLDGSLDSMSRAAIADWQKKHEVTQTSLLGPVQLAVLRAESEAMFQRSLAPPTAAQQPMRSVQVSHPRYRRVGSGGPQGFEGAIGGFFAGMATGFLIRH